MNANETLDREFLQIRAKILQIAASLDRIDRSEGSPQTDPRLDKVAESLRVLQSSTPNSTAPDRAAQVQHVFSLPYRPNWRAEFGI